MASQHTRKKHIPADHYQVRYGGLQEKIFRLILGEERGSVWVDLLRVIATWTAWFYDKGVTLRNLLFDRGVLRIHRLNCPVISVGNLTMGGTGKTPMVVWLASLFSKEGYRVGIVSRGYGGVESSRVIVVSDGENIRAEQGISGDEPLMLARRLQGTPVLCSSKKAEAAKAAIEKFKCNALILDDGFQHRYLARDLDIVMLDSRNPFGSGKLFPRGTLREKGAALARAQVLVLTRFDQSEDAEKNCHDLRRQWPDKAVVTAAHRPVRIFSAVDHGERPLTSLTELRLAAFAGIARPNDFFQSVQNLGARLVYTAAFPDHYPLTSELLASLVREASKVSPELWLTTEKDWVRLPQVLPQDMELWVLAMEIDLDRDGLQLVGMVLRTLRGGSLGSEDVKG
ncbi:MAG: tetraacyldisaccharide 4'-kinase [Deltaproteobacteria bacterium]|jgi:tetraacyldisaccharide 4'-kinase